MNMDVDITMLRVIRQELDAEVDRAFQEAIKPVGTSRDKWPILWMKLSSILVLLCDAAAAVDEARGGRSPAAMPDYGAAPAGTATAWREDESDPPDPEARPRRRGRKARQMVAIDP